jgi:hypothetical protein
MRPFPDMFFTEFPKEFSIIKKLNSPAKVQDFLNSLAVNFETNGETCLSPLLVLREKKAHCMEGALLASAIFWYHGERPLLLDLKTTNDDNDHVVALFRSRSCWGAVSKTNHAVLRYRDPIYKDIRELAMSYFNEYFLDSGVKTLRSYSLPFDLSVPSKKFDDSWLTTKENLWNLTDALDMSKHISILKKGATRRLRRADPLEIKAGKIVEQKKK